MEKNLLSRLILLSFTLFMVDAVLRQVMPQWYEHGYYTGIVFTVSVALLCGLTFYPSLKFYLQNKENFSWKNGFRLKPDPGVVAIVLFAYITGPLLIISSSTVVVHSLSVVNLKLPIQKDLTATAIHLWQHAETEKGRNLGMSAIGGDYGVALPIQSDETDIAGTLSSKQSELYRDNLAVKAQVEQLKSKAIGDMNATLKLSGVFIVIFAVTFLMMMLKDNRSKVELVRRRHYRFSFYGVIMACPLLYLLIEYGDIVQIRWLTMILLGLIFPPVLLFVVATHIANKGRRYINASICTVLIVFQSIAVWTHSRHVEREFEAIVIDTDFKQDIRSALNALIAENDSLLRYQGAQSLYHHLGLAVDFRNDHNVLETFKPKSTDVQIYHDNVRALNIKMVRLERAYSEEKQLRYVGITYGLALFLFLGMLLPIAKKYYQRGLKMDS